MLSIFLLDPSCLLHEAFLVFLLLRMLRVLDLSKVYAVYAVGPAYLQNYRRFPWISGIPWIPNLLRCWPTSSKSPAFRSCSSDPASLQMSPRCTNNLCSKTTQDLPLWSRQRTHLAAAILKAIASLARTNQSCSLTASIASSSIYWKLLKHITIQRERKHCEAHWKIFESGNAVKQCQTHSACTVKNRNKFRIVQNRQLQDAPRCSKRTSCQPRHAEKDNLRWPGSRCCIPLRRTWISMNLNESNDLHMTYMKLHHFSAFGLEPPITMSRLQVITMSNCEILWV